MLVRVREGTMRLSRLRDSSWQPRLRLPPRQKLRAEPLRLGDTLHLDRDRIDGLLQLLEPRID